MSDTSLASEIQSLTDRLKNDLRTFRHDQKVIMPQIADHVATELKKPANLKIETQQLFLPSDFTAAQRKEFDLIKLGMAQHQLLEGAAYDTLSQLRRDARFVESLSTKKEADCYGQDGHTREQKNVLEARRRRDVTGALYSHLRQAMLNLGMRHDDTTFKKLTSRSFFRKATGAKRVPGDSRRPDGMLWAGEKRKLPTAVADLSTLREANTPFNPEISEPVATQTSQRNARTSNSPN